MRIDVLGPDFPGLVADVVGPRRAGQFGETDAQGALAAALRPSGDFTCHRRGPAERQAAMAAIELGPHGRRIVLQRVGRSQLGRRDEFFQRRTMGGPATSGSIVLMSNRAE